MKKILGIIALTLFAANANAAILDLTATSAGGHSVWFPGIGAPNLQFENGPEGHGLFRLDTDSGEAKLGGIVAGNGLAFSLEASMSGLRNSNRRLCRQAKYESGATRRDCLGSWLFFTGGLSGTLSEIGGLGRNYALSILHPRTLTRMPLPQLGPNKANAKNDKPGFSAWIGLELLSCNRCGVDYGTLYKGDINIDLHRVPEPALLGLFTLGLAGIGFTRRFRSA